MKCAFYEKEITPPLGSDIPGYYCNRPSTGVKDRIYAKAAVFTNGETPEDAAAMVVIDTVELNRGFCDAIIDRASKYTGIPKDHIAVSATHSHYGIPSGDDISVRDPLYMELFVKLAADCITLAYQRLEPCQLFYAKGEVDGIAFVRDMRLKDGIIRTNPSKKYQEEILEPMSKSDPELPIILAKDAEGKPMGALLSYACHLDCVGGTEHTGDYSSELSRQLKAAYGKDFVSIYLAGASGDINHINFMTYERSNYIDMGQRLGAEAIRVLENAEPMKDDVAVQRRMVTVKRRRATQEELDYAKWRIEDLENRKDPNKSMPVLASLLLKYHNETKDLPDEETFPVHVFKLGEAFVFASPGELYHRYGDQMKHGCPGAKGLIAELSNAEIGYVPIPEVLGTGAYPAQLCNGAHVDGAAGDTIVKNMLEMAFELEDR